MSKKCFYLRLPLLALSFFIFGVHAKPTEIEFLDAGRPFTTMKIPENTKMKIESEINHNVNPSRTNFKGGVKISLALPDGGKIKISTDEVNVLSDLPEGDGDKKQ